MHTDLLNKIEENPKRYTNNLKKLSKKLDQVLEYKEGRAKVQLHCDNNGSCKYFKDAEKGCRYMNRTVGPILCDNKFAHIDALAKELEELL